MKRNLLFLLLWMVAGQLYSQKHHDISARADTLRVLGEIILNAPDDRDKLNANVAFTEQLHRVLADDKAFAYGFDSVTTMARLTAPDHSFRLFNWHVRLRNGTYQYFAVLSLHPKKFRHAAQRVILLIDKSDEITEPETDILSAEKWYGAHYYKIIMNKHKKGKTYTLLGWDGNNNLSNKKIIEVLTFDPNGVPVFGRRMFDNLKAKKAHQRIVFEYAKESSMSLKYEKQFSKPGRKPVYMIVFDHLAPKDPALKQDFRFYVPDTHIFDAFLFRQGKWNFIGDIDARNPKQSPVKHKPPMHELMPPGKN